MNNKIYLFSGLGSDERVFQKLDFVNFDITFIEWTKTSKSLKIEEYATLLINQIKSKQPILIGLSFGGLIAIEVAKQIDTQKVILIASVKTKKEIPFYFRFIGAFNFHKLIPSSLLTKTNFITNWLFSITKEDDKKLLKQILAETDKKFMKWAIDKVVKWTNTFELKNIFHIHGTCDNIFPISFVSCNYQVNGGGHFMTITKPEELSKIIRQQLMT